MTHKCCRRKPSANPPPNRVAPSWDLQKRWASHFFNQTMSNSCHLMIGCCEIIVTLQIVSDYDLFYLLHPFHFVFSFPRPWRVLVKFVFWVWTPSCMLLLEAITGDNLCYQYNDTYDLSFILKSFVYLEQCYVIQRSLPHGRQYHFPLNFVVNCTIIQTLFWSSFLLWNLVSVSLYSSVGYICLLLLSFPDWAV